MELDELLELCKTDPFEIAKEVDKYLELKEYGREQTMDATAIENAMKYVSKLEMHSAGLKDCIALEGLLEKKARKTPNETKLLEQVQKHKKQATPELEQWAYFDLGILAFERGLYETATELFNKAAISLKDETNPLIYYNMGLVRQAAGDSLGAFVHYNTACMQDPKQYHVLNNSAIVQAVMQKKNTAKKIFMDALKVKPNGEEALLNLALLCKTEDKLYDCKVFFEQLPDITPKIKKLAGLLSIEYFKRGEYEKARRYGQEYIKYLIEQQQISKS